MAEENELDTFTTENLSKLTYPRDDLHHVTVRPEDLERYLPLDNGRHSFDKITSNLGKLDVLPLEILQMFLSHLDLQTITTLRSVNKCARLYVDSVPEYQKILAHAPSVLRASIGTGAATWITCTQLFDTLVNPICCRCPDFAPFIYLLTGQRVCYVCLCHYDDFLPISPAMARRTYELSDESIVALNRIIVLPGSYSRCGAKRKGGSALVDRTAALSAWRAEREEEGEDSGSPPSIPSKGKQPSIGDLNSNRFVATVRAPWLNVETNATEEGFSCSLCQSRFYSGGWNGNGRSFWERMFTTRTFLEHVRECPSLRDRGFPGGNFERGGLQEKYILEHMQSIVEDSEGSFSIW